MQELEEILEEVNRLIEKHKNNAYELVAKEPLTQCYTETDIEQTKVHELAVVRDIIRKHMNDGWTPVDERLPEKPENGYQEPEYNVMIKDAIIPTTLKFTSKGKWKDDLGQEYEIIAWRPLPEPYRTIQPETCKYTGGACCWPIDQCKDCPNHPGKKCCE